MYNIGTGKNFLIEEFKRFSGKADMFNYTQILNFCRFFVVKMSDSQSMVPGQAAGAAAASGKQKYKFLPPSLDLMNQKSFVWCPIIWV